MALARVHVWAEGEVLTASDLNVEFNNIINNPVSVISPLTGNLDVNNNSLTNVANITSFSGTMGIIEQSIPAFVFSTSVSLQPNLLLDSRHPSLGGVITFYHNVNPLDGQTAGTISWIGKSGGTDWNIATYSVVRGGAEDASHMFCTHAFTTQNDVNQGGANTTATLAPTGVWTDASGAAIKRYIDVPMDGVLDKFKSLNTLGVYVGKHASNDGERHYSSTAEEFYDIFGLGNNPSNKPEWAGIAPKDVSWLAVKAIMELEQRVACLEVG